MQLIDSHCHLNMEGLADRLPQVFANMAQNQVAQALAISVSRDSFAQVLAIAEAHPHIYATVGIHPDSETAAEFTAAELVQHAADTLRLLREHGAEKTVIHCFTEDTAFAKAALDLGCHLSFSGILTFKNAADIQAAAQYCPADRLLVETDSPYLAPVPHRCKPNEPAYVRHTAEFLARLRGVSLEQIAETTTENFHRLFAKVPRIKAA